MPSGLLAGSGVTAAAAAAAAAATVTVTRTAPLAAAWSRARARQPSGGRPRPRARPGTNTSHRLRVTVTCNRAPGAVTTEPSRVAAAAGGVPVPSPGTRARPRIGPGRHPGRPAGPLAHVTPGRTQSWSAQAGTHGDAGGRLARRAPSHESRVAAADVGRAEGRRRRDSVTSEAHELAKSERLRECTSNSSYRSY